MFERIKKHVEEREAINAELEKIMSYCDDSPINMEFINKKWEVIDDELHLQVNDEDLEDDYYGYEISSMGAKGEDFFMGEKDGYTYVMAHDGDWEQTQVFVLKSQNKIDNE
jgi:hypothetical protein